MSLPHAILTSLLEKPCTGAELARRFDKSLGHFWQATHQQIYRELGKLEGERLIAARGLATARGSQRHFDVLPRGRAELERWSLRQADPRPIRDSLLVRLRAAAVLGTVDMSAEIRRHRELHADTLERYRTIEARDFPPGVSLERAGELQRAVLRAGIVFEESWLAWCDETLAVRQ
ncbi:PadR family transcriptional regulator [Arthrobacter livingstonensis]|uniref:PadR family transcriptional regulator n=1 Tax=Arthrobacter livingstonensis TaxID=670078 RepID=A0A2V5L3Q8_9MICC|nr:PadR family transcriptional regulator [Arthrobacter livingstonensis]PYI66061.1 PadR family transcriptional regulator [Arthrobacter livingstonensis]